MANYRVQVQAFAKALQKNAKSYAPFMANAARARFIAAKSAMLENLESHNVSRELKRGPYEDSNISQTMGLPNLFAFIGFEAGADPVGDLRQFLEDTVQMQSLSPSIRHGATSTTYGFYVNVPSMTQIWDATPLPFDGNRSWVRAIETGIWGLSHFLNGMLLNPPKEFEQSRSGPAIQSKHYVRSASFRKTPYMREILDGFRNSLLAI